MENHQKALWRNRPSRETLNLKFPVRSWAGLLCFMLGLQALNKDVRYMPPRPLEESSCLLAAQIVRAIGRQTIPRNLVFVWHCRGWVTQPHLLLPQTWRRICEQPLDMLFARVPRTRTEPVPMFVTEFQCKPTEPNVMRQRSGCPNRTWMLGMSLLVAPLP